MHLLRHSNEHHSSIFLSGLAMGKISQSVCLQTRTTAAFVCKKLSFSIQNSLHCVVCKVTIVTHCSSIKWCCHCALYAKFFAILLQGLWYSYIPKMPSFYRLAVLTLPHYHLLWQGSATAEGLHHALCQLKSCQLLHVYKDSTWKDCSKWMTLNATQVHPDCRYSINHISLPISGP